MDVWQTTEEVSLETYSPSFTSYKTQSAQNPALSRVSAWIRAPPLLSQMLSFLHGFLTNAGRNSIPTLSAARDDGISRRPRPGDAPTSTLIWGPISYTDAQAAGAHAPTCTTRHVGNINQHSTALHLLAEVVAREAPGKARADNQHTRFHVYM